MYYGNLLINIFWRSVKPCQELNLGFSLSGRVCYHYTWTQYQSKGCLGGAILAGPQRVYWLLRSQESSRITTRGGTGLDRTPPHLTQCWLLELRSYPGRGRHLARATRGASMASLWLAINSTAPGLPSQTPRDSSGQ